MHYVVEVAAHDAILGSGFLRKLAVAQDRAENIVEVVRNAPGERSHCFHLLRLSELSFEALPLHLSIFSRGDLDRGADEANHLAGPVAQSASARLHPMPLAIGMAD